MLNIIISLSLIVSNLVVPAPKVDNYLDETARWNTYRNPTGITGALESAFVTIINNAAVAAQGMRAIVPYDVTINLPVLNMMMN